jgi:hypothetical protein
MHLCREAGVLGTLPIRLSLRIEYSSTLHCTPDLPRERLKVRDCIATQDPFYPQIKVDMHDLGRISVSLTHDMRR